MRARIVCVLLLASACGARQKPESALPAHTAAGVLLPTDDLGPPFMVEQRLHGHYGERDVSLDCVVQLQEGTLTVVGLTPFGSRAFVIEQRGTAVRFEKFVDRKVPFEPVHVLYDLHRVFFRGLKGPLSDGVHEGQDAGELVRERWAGGHIVERRFESLEGPASNMVVVAFQGAPAPVVAPHVKLTNIAFGYTLEIENSEQKQLAPSYTLEVESGSGS
ncbi:MAG TPA: DUF3261 domain-containing protein [Polyangiaceae bacterium]|nr:DUF3261 domain-containing protein [Polyangiaceae bacterium]